MKLGSEGEGQVWSDLSIDWEEQGEKTAQARQRDNNTKEPIKTEESAAIKFITRLKG